MKEMFIKNGFQITYDTDLDEANCRWILFYSFISGDDRKGTA